MEKLMSDFANNAGLPDPVAHRAFYDGATIKRAIAWVIDVVLIGILSALVLPFTAFTGLFFFPLLMMFVGFFYRWLSIANKSATLGMRIMAIELRDARGQRLDSATAFWHTAGYTFSVITAPVQLVSMGMMALTDRGQGLSDTVLGTVMLNRSA